MKNLPTAHLLRKTGFLKLLWARRCMLCMPCTPKYASNPHPPTHAHAAQGAASLLHGYRFHCTDCLDQADTEARTAAEQATLRAGRGARTAGSSGDDVSRDYQWCCLLCDTTKWPEHRLKTLDRARARARERENEGDALWRDGNGVQDPRARY